MFPFPSLPQHWEKRVIFFLLHKLNLLEERTLGDLDNLQGTAGRFTFKNIGIKVERLRDLLKLPPRLELREAVIGTLSIRLPASLFYSGSVEIVVSDVRIAAALNPAPTEDPISPPASPPGPSHSLQEDEDPEEFPKTAEDLAQSFLHAQSDEDKRQLLSIYADRETGLASSVASSVVSEDDDPDVGVGTSLGLPNVVTNVFKGMLDRLTVKIRGTVASLDATLPEDRGGERVLLTVEIEDVDVEGVSRNVAPISAEDASERQPREGKRRITLENIQGYVTSVATLFETEDTQGSEVFGTRSEASTEKAVRESTTSLIDEDEIESSTHTLRKASPEQRLPSPVLPNSSLEPRELSLEAFGSSSRTPPQKDLADELPEEYHDTNAEEEQEDLYHSTYHGGQSMYSEAGRFSNYDDEEDSDDEVLAFAPATSSLRASYRPGAPSDSAHEQYHDYDEDSEDEVEGGAMFSPTIPSQPPSQSPSVSMLSASPAAHDLPTPPVSGTGYETDGSDDMDQEASKLLSQSTIFSHEDADSIYMSATSGILRDQEPVQPVDERENLQEDVDTREMDDRLDRLINGDVADDPPDEPITPRPQSPVATVPEPLSSARQVKKKCLGLDRITIFYPALADSPAPSDTSAEPSYDRYAGQGNMPGAFSMYASSIANRSTPSSPSPSSTLPKATGKKSGPKVKIAETNPTMGSESIFGAGDLNPARTADIEVIVGDARGTVDLPTEKALAHVMESFQTAIQEGKEGAQKQKSPDRKKSDEGKTIQLLAEEMDVRMVERLPGVFLDTNEEISGDPTVRLQCLLNDIKLYRKPHSEDSSTSWLDIKKFALSDEEEGIITFIPPLPPSTKMPRRRPNPSSTHGGDGVDISVIFSQSPTKKRINIVTLPIRLHFDLKRLEEAFSAFGGVGSVLASTTASTATITKTRQQSQRKDPAALPPTNVNTKVDAKVGGLVVEVVGTSGRVNLKASPLRVKFETGHGANVGIDEISIWGPLIRQAPTIKLEDARIEFASTPTQEDLSRLLELLTPSKNRFDNDDILIDTLLRQREQGSVLRVFVRSVQNEIVDPNQDLEGLKGLGDEVVKVLTATDFVASDERPGLLTLVNIGMASIAVQVGGGIGLIQADMEGVGLTHVSAPSLLALAVGSVGVRRNGGDELLGEGLERRMFAPAEYERPMVMVRMVGDEPEPVVKIKLWNVKVEYRVETLLEMMQAPDNATGETLAQEMVDSIVRLPPPAKDDKDSTAVLGFDVVATDCVIGLNPLDIKSRGLVVLTDLQLQAALPAGGTVRAGMMINKASVLVIDDVNNCVPAEPGQKRGRREVMSEHLAGFASMGFVPVVTISSAKVQLRVVETGPRGEKAVDLDVSDDLLLLESCADSTQTLLAVFNGLKPPLPETEEIKYCTEVLPVDMLASLDEGAFLPMNRKASPESEIDPDDFHDFSAESPGVELPADFAFVESFYGHDDPQRKPNVSEQHGYLSVSGPSWIPPPLPNGSASKEKVTMLDDEPLIFEENHFGVTTHPREGQRRLNEKAVNNAPYFPLRIRAHDIHVIWNLHDGYDWQRTRDTISQAVKRVESKAAERRERNRNRRVSLDIDDDESVVDDFLFNSIYVGIPANRDPRELTGEINRNFDDHISETSYATTTAESSRPLSTRSRTTSDTGRRGRSGLRLTRSRHHKMQFELKGVGAEVLLFPPNSGEVQTSVDLKVRDLEIFDNIPTSTWKKFVTYMQDAGGREMGSNMAHIEILNVRPVPELAASELVLKVTILPLRLHVDQDALDFLTRFFEFKDDNAAPSKSPSSTDQPFLQRVEVNAVRVKLDYKPKKVDYAGLRSGHTTEFMNFFILDEADMVLRRVILHGIPGFQRMSVMLNDTWMPDIKKTQLADVLAGVAPVRSLVNLGVGVRDLVAVPVREYRKDGRVVRSIQKGVGRFVKTSATEMVRLGAKVAVGTQALLQGAENTLEGGHEGLEFTSDEEVETEERKISLYADQPMNVTDGLIGASRSLKRNFGDARAAIMAVPGEAASTGSAAGAARAVARAAPRAVLRPAIGASEALSKALQGATNALDPDMRRRAEDKYKRH